MHLLSNINKSVCVVHIYITDVDNTTVCTTRQQLSFNKVWCLLLEEKCFHEHCILLNKSLTSKSVSSIGPATRVHREFLKVLAVYRLHLPALLLVICKPLNCTRFIIPVNNCYHICSIPTFVAF